METAFVTLRRRGLATITTSNKKKNKNTDAKVALVLGSSGALGSTMVEYLSKQHGNNMIVIGADVVKKPEQEQSFLDGFIHVVNSSSTASTSLELHDMTKILIRGIHNYLYEYEQDGIDAIIVASGGFEADPKLADITSSSSLYDDDKDGELLLEDVVEDEDSNDEDSVMMNLNRQKEREIAMMEKASLEYSSVMDRMRRVNLDPVLAIGLISQYYMRLSSSSSSTLTHGDDLYDFDDDDDSGSTGGSTGGLIVMIGATAALSPTPGMLSYGLSKVATHHVVQTLGTIMTGSIKNSNSNSNMSASSTSSVFPKSIRKQGRKALLQNTPHHKGGNDLDRCCIIGILPTTIDTPANRIAMPKNAGFDHDSWTKPIDIAKQIDEWIHIPPLRPHSGSLIKVIQPNKNNKKRNNHDGSSTIGANFELVR